MKVCVIGTGYVGLVTGTCLAYLGHTVVCVDKDEEKIAKLTMGQSPIYEPGLTQLLLTTQQRGHLQFSTDLVAGVRAAEIIFIAVGTPPLPSGKADLSAVKAVAHSIGRALDDQQRRIIVNKSTVPIGSGNWVEMLVREGLQDNPNGNALVMKRDQLFDVASNPEFLREGSALQDTFYPDRIVLGTTHQAAAARLRVLYEPLIEQTFSPPSGTPRPVGFTAVPVVTTDLASAEMIKYAANAFLATKISFANEIANLCERVGADIREVVRGFGLDNRIGSRFLNAGIGWGGSCFGKDVAALVEIACEYGYEPQLLRATIEVNQRQRHVAVQKLQALLKILKGKTIGLLGLAFKPETDDLRDAPALTIAQDLLGMGASVKVYDPIAMAACREQHPELKLHYASNVTDLATDCDAVVLVTEWEEFRHLNPEALGAVMRQRVMIDGRNLLAPEAFTRADFIYRGIGR